MVGIKQVLVVLLVALVTVAPLPSRAELLLERVVMLSRHGVRAPTMSNDTLAQFSSRPWPTWPTPIGYLTPRGKALAKLMGAYYRAMLTRRGLFTADDCPSPGLVHVRADLDQRTIATGVALLEGLFPNCELRPYS